MDSPNPASDGSVVEVEPRVTRRRAAKSATASAPATTDADDTDTQGGTAANSDDDGDDYSGVRLTLAPVLAGWSYRGSSTRATSQELTSSARFSLPAPRLALPLLPPRLVARTRATQPSTSTPRGRGRPRGRPRGSGRGRGRGRGRDKGLSYNPRISELRRVPTDGAGIDDPVRPALPHYPAP